MVYVKEVTMPLSVYVMVDLQEMIVQSLYVQEHPNVVGMVNVSLLMELMLQLVYVIMDLEGCHVIPV